MLVTFFRVRYTDPYGLAIRKVMYKPERNERLMNQFNGQKLVDFFHDKLEKNDTLRRTSEYAHWVVDRSDLKDTPSVFALAPAPLVAAPAIAYGTQVVSSISISKKTVALSALSGMISGSVTADKDGGVMDELNVRTHRMDGNHTRHDRPSNLTPSQRRKEIREHNKQRGAEYLLPGEGI